MHSENERESWESFASFGKQGELTQKDRTLVKKIHSKALGCACALEEEMGNPGL